MKKCKCLIDFKYTFVYYTFYSFLLFDPTIFAPNMFSTVFFALKFLTSFIIPNGTSKIIFHHHQRH